MVESLEFDAVVIGAGVIGLAVAKEICNNCDNVLVIDKESDFGQHVSSRHSGVIHSGIYYTPGSLKAKLCVEGNKMLYDFAEKNNIDYLNCGKLVVGHDDADLNELEKLFQKGNINGVLGLELLSYSDAVKLQPGIKCQNALWVPSTGIIDSHNVMNQLEKQIIEKGGILHYNSEVTAIQKLDNEYAVSINNQETVTTPVVINCAGLWCDVISNMLGITGYKIHFCKGDYYQSNKYKNLKRLIYPLPGKIGLGIHTVLQLDGSVSFGPNAYYVDEIDYSIDETFIDSFHKSINEYLDLERADLKLDYTGIRPKPFAANEEPMDFIIKNERDSGFSNFINLIGIESPGLTSSLAIAKYVSTLIE